MTLRDTIPFAFLTLITLQGCSAHQVNTAGAVTLGIGAVATGGGLCLATGIDPYVEDDPATPEAETGRTKAYPEAGVVTMAGGLAVMVVGGVMLGLSDSAPRTKPRTPPPMTGGSSTFRGRSWP